MARIGIFILCWCCLALGKLAGQQLSEQAQVQVLTCAPGEPLFSAFGHSAFRIVDPGIQLDRIYNYGTFDFRTPNFYGKFVQGKLPYFLDDDGPGSFLQEYMRDQREVKVQTLNLSNAEANGVFQYLENNLLPENRQYPYDFFFDNCATRERDVLTEVLGAKLDWNPWPSDSLGSLRDLLDIYLEERKWADFGIDLILGLPADREADQQLSMFLPDFLFLALDRARVKDGDQSRSLVKDTYVWVKPERELDFSDGPITPLMVTWGFFGLTFLVTLLFSARHPVARAFDGLFFFVLGALGLFLLGMWVATNHQATYANLNVLWAHPIYLVFAFLRFSRNPRRQFNFARWCGLWLGLLVLILYWFFPQPYNAAVWPLIFASALRLLDVVRGTFDH